MFVAKRSKRRIRFDTDIKTHTRLTLLTVMYVCFSLFLSFSLAISFSFPFYLKKRNAHREVQYKLDDSWEMLQSARKNSYRIANNKGVLLAGLSQLATRLNW